MKNSIICGVLALSLFSCSKGDKKEPVTFANNNDKLSYSIGVDAGREIANTIKGQGMDSIINRELLVRGLEDAILEHETAINPDSAKMIIRSYFMKAQETRMQEELKKYEKNKEAGEKFLAENKTKPGVVTTESGLQYEVIKSGNGPKPQMNDSATVHYTGTFLSGEKFDSSLDRNEPFTFLVSYGGGVIDGWVEAAQLMPAGSKFRFWLPSDLAYGDMLHPAIPPYSMLIFEIELLKVIPAKK